MGQPRLRGDGVEELRKRIRAYPALATYEAKMISEESVRKAVRELKEKRERWVEDEAR